MLQESYDSQFGLMRLVLIVGFFIVAYMLYNLTVSIYANYQIEKHIAEFESRNEELRSEKQPKNWTIFSTTLQRNTSKKPLNRTWVSFIRVRKSLSSPMKHLSSWPRMKNLKCFPNKFEPLGPILRNGGSFSSAATPLNPNLAKGLFFPKLTPVAG